MPAGTTWTQPDGGFYVWVTLPDGLDAKAMLPRAVDGPGRLRPGHRRSTPTGQRPRTVHAAVRTATPSPTGSARASAGSPASSRRSSTCTRPSGVDTDASGAGAAAAVEDRLATPQDLGRDRTAAGRIRRVAVLAGGLSHERDVSLRSGRRVADALRGAGLDGRAARRRRRAAAALAARPADAVFIALHGGAGEDGAVRERARPARRPVRRVPGRPPAGSPATSRPPRRSSRAAGLRDPDSVALPHATFRELGAGACSTRIVARLGLPLMVKPARGGSALGAPVVAGSTTCPAAMVGCFAYGDTALVERFVDGTEVAVSVVDPGDGPDGPAGRRDRARRRGLRLRRALHRRGRPSSTPRPGSPDDVGRACAELRRRGAPGARPARPVARRPRRRRRGHAVVPRGQRRARA